MRRSASRRLFFAAATTLAIAGCRLFVDLDGLTGGSPPDASSTDAPADVFVPTDANGDVAPDVTDVPAEDADASVPPCTLSTNLLGSDNAAGKTSDGTPSANIDAVGFTAPGAGVARCGWFFVDAIGLDGGSMDLTLGVYTNNASDAPDKLVAQTTMKNVVLGWNHAPLDAPVVLKTGDTLWLAYSPSVGSVGERVSSTCGPTLYQHVDELRDGGFPTTFTTTVTFTDTCNASVYLGP